MYRTKQLQIIRNKTYMSDIRIVPVQQICVLCSDELHVTETTQGIAAQFCHACIRFLHEQVFFRELEQHPKIVRV